MMQEDQNTTMLSPAERRQRNREEVVNGILEAARVVMRQEGVAALNLQEVARLVGMRAPSLYTYFSNRTAIYDAVFRQGMRQYREGIAAVIDQHGATWDAIEAALEFSMQFAHDTPEVYQLLFQRPVPGYVPSDASMEEAGKLLELSYSTVQRMKDAGLLASGVTAVQFNNLFIALMHGLTALHMANEPDAAISEGRFGSLIPLALQMLKTTWSPKPD
jgi:AcrR family transcriptional regulator